MSPRKAPRSPTLIDVAVENVGVLRAGQAVGLLVAWCWSITKYGPDVTPEQYGEHWKLARSTAFRHRKTVLDAFDGVDLNKVAAYVAENFEVGMSQRRAMRVGGQVAVVQLAEVG